MGFLRRLFSPWIAAGQAAFEALDATMAPPRRPAWGLAAAVLSTLVAWWVYVPIHELLHAFGCMAFGGQVKELQIGASYGGALIERVVPFVRAGGEYAGRLSGFDTHGSDWTYLATDVAPYFLTLMFAFPLLVVARRRRSPMLFGPGAVLLAAPVMGMVGDFYEIGSILVSALLRFVLGTAQETRVLALRHDDLLALLPEFSKRFPTDGLAWGAAVAASSILGIALSGLTLAAARRIPGLLSRNVDVPGVAT